MMHGLMYGAIEQVAKESGGFARSLDATYAGGCPVHQPARSAEADQEE
jgi:hypothetical protein